MPVTELILICAGVAYVCTEAIKRSLNLKGKKNIQRLISTAIGIGTAAFICDADGEPTKKQLLVGLMGGSGATFLIMMLKGHLGSKNKLLNQLVESSEESMKDQIVDKNNNGIDDALEEQIIKEALEKEKAKEKLIKEALEKEKAKLEDKITICINCSKSICECKK